MQAEPLLLENCKLVLHSWRGDVSVGVSIYAEGGRIEWIGSGGPPPGSKTGRVIDCRGYLVLPCLYNAHTHSPMTLVRGLNDDSSLTDWLKAVWTVENSLTPEAVYYASVLAAAEMALGGTCGFIDMYFYPEQTVRAARELGLRVALGPVVMGDVDPYRAVEEAERFARRHAEGDWVKPIVNVHSVYTVPLEAVREAASKSRELGLPLHIHASETLWEVRESRRRYGATPIELLARIGALHAKTIIAHACWATRRELELVGAAGATIAHCPTSNMKLATGSCLHLLEAESYGANIALGTDGPASNNSLDMLQEMKTMTLHQRQCRRDTAVKAAHALKAATVGSARAMGLREAGEVRPGYKADIILIDAAHPRLQPLRPDNTLPAIVYSATAETVAYTIVGGKPLHSPEEREKLAATAAKAAEKLNRIIERMIENVKTSTPAPPCSPPPACRKTQQQPYRRNTAIHPATRKNHPK